MKRLLLLLLALSGGMAFAQQPEGVEGVRMDSRANVITYEDENAIEKLRYDSSPYWIPLSGWLLSSEDDYPVLSQEYPIPKDWRDYRLFFSLQAPAGYGLFIGDKLVGVSHEAGVPTEFDITGLVRFGKNAAFSLRRVGDDDGTLLDAPLFDGSLSSANIRTAILLKPLQNVQDFTLTTQFFPGQQAGSYTIEADFFNYKKKGKCYFEVVIWDPQGKEVDKVGKWVWFDKRTVVSQTLTSTLSKVQEWNAESPRLYTAVIRLYDENMEDVDLVGTRFGFRSVEVQENLFLNGKEITFRGVTLNRYPRMETPEDVRAARNMLVQMKLNNINALRTCAPEPAPERLLELCDELGFYVVMDANLFPASSMGQAVATDIEYSDLFVSRMRSLYGRNKNHTCIVAWSLGDSPDNGICMINAYKALKGLDRQRPVLCSGAQYAENTDLIAPLHVNLDFLRQYMGKNPSRALVMLSFGNVDGNTFGGMQPLWQKVYDQRLIQGGFYDCGTWEAVADKPYLAELKLLYAPMRLRMVSTSVDQAEFEITNLSDFRTLADYKLEYVIGTALKPAIVEGDVSVSVKAGQSRTITLKIPALNLYADEELFILFTLRQRNNTPSIPKNTLLASYQFPLSSSHVARLPYEVEMPATLDITPADSNGIVRITGHDFEWQYSHTLGAVTSLVYKGQSLLSTPLRLNFMRAPSPNDNADPNGTRQWRRYNNGNMQCEVVASVVHPASTASAGIDVMLRYSTDGQESLFDVRQTYLVLPSGDLLVDNDITVSEQLKSIASVGLTMGIDTTLDTIEWFGRDLDSYPDRCSAGTIGHSTLPLGKAITSYGESHHTETRWVALRSASKGIYVDLLDTLCNFTIAIPPIGGPMLTVNHSTTGVGGATAGMPLDESVLLKSHRYRFVFHMRPYDVRHNAPRFLRRIEYPRVTSGILEMPVITKSRDRFDGPMTITLGSSDPKVRIHYTLDGTMPTEQSPRYTKPFTLNSSTIVRARAYKDGESPSFVATEQFTFDYVTECTYRHKPNTPYNKNASRALFDGEQGDVNDLSRGWLGFSGHDVEATLALAKAVRVGAVTVRFAHVPDAWVFAPRQVLVAVSSDGEHFSRPVEADITYDATAEAMNTTQLQVLTVPMHSGEVTHIRVTARPIEHIPAWHRAKGLNPWIMLDEIIIQEELLK